MELQFEEVEVLLGKGKVKGDHSSKVHPDLEKKPGGPDNWVEKVSGLPSFIKRIAKHIRADSGYSTDHAIASAVNRCEELAAKGNAQAIAALAQWEAKKKAARALSMPSVSTVDLAYTGRSRLRQIRNIAYSTFGNAQSSGTSGIKGASFNEDKHNRTSGGQFANKLNPSELIAAKRQIEGGITNLRVGDTFTLPGKVGWVKRTAGGYFVQGNGGFVASVRTLSEAVTAAASLIAKKGFDK